jgi:general secretion pathway protein G
MHQPNNGQRTTDNGPRRGFTLVELMVVIIVLAILVALLLPVLNGALRTARNSAVQAEINQLAQALEAFKAKYGDYPPSRIYLAEDGDYSGGGTGGGAQVNSPVSDYFGYTGVSSSQPDIKVSQLIARSAAILRKFFPRLVLRTDGHPVFPHNSNIWYDFNGDGRFGVLPPGGGFGGTAPYILQGHECLVFFLGGVPLPATPGSATSTFSMTGFGKDPTNPFTNSIVGSSMYSANRQPPFFEFNAGRLFLDPTRLDAAQHNVPGYRQCNIPGYVDSLTGTAPIPGTSVNFYAYFSAYGNGNYDPNDVNFPETDPSGGVSPAIGLKYSVGFPVWTGQGNPTQVLFNLDQSPAPNPYTTTLTANNPGGALPSGTVGYQKPQSYQIISPGADGLYGVGGQYQPPSSSASIPLPFDSANVINTTDSNVRTREYDNLTNFKAGTLY